jgi:hypothetical protein
VPRHDVEGAVAKHGRETSLGAEKFGSQRRYLAEVRMLAAAHPAPTCFSRLPVGRPSTQIPRNNGAEDSVPAFYR